MASYAPSIVSPAGTGAVPRPAREPDLVALLRQTLAASAAPAARIEERLRGRLISLRGDFELDPFAHPVMLAALEVSRMIDREQVTIGDLAALAHRLAVRAFADRAEHLATYLGELSIEANKAAIARIVRFIAQDGRMPFEQFKRRLERPILGIVLTAHPTFGRPMSEAQLLNGLATGADEHGIGLDEARARAAVEAAAEATHLPPAKLTLAVEHAWSLHALRYIQEALDTAKSVAFEVAAELYPADWTRLSPNLCTAATWVGYDLDGRSDIAWSDTFSKRLLVKQSQVKRHLARIADLASAAPVLGEALSPLRARLEQASAALVRQIAAIDAVTASADTIGDLVTVFLATREAALTDTGPLIAMVDAALPLATDNVTRRQLLVLRTALARHGLGLAHTHVRLNSSQLHNAIRKQVGMESAPNDPAHRRTYMTTINDLLSRVKPETVNFATLTTERATAKRLFMIVQQFGRYIDANVTVRFLIAETEAGFTLLTALYFARLFGVEDKVEISPLYETAEAIEHGDQLLDDALKSPYYRDYVRKLGRICIQFGFSDSGRYLGQMAATFQLERLKLRLAGVLERHGLADIEVVVFNTHGESIGRGGHPGSLADRIRYVAPPFSRAAFARQSIALKEEISFQGGDGFQLFMGLPTALAVVRGGLDALVLPDPEAENDPVYRENDFAVEFFATIRQRFAALVDDPAYAALLGAFGGNLSPGSGSRPVKRQHEGALRPLDVAHVSQLRAIPNNTILQQMAMMANTLHGVGAARAKDPELFDDLNRHSPRFHRAMQMVSAALGASDLDILRAYIDTFDPGLWLSRSGRTRSPTRAAELRAVAERMEEIDLHTPLSKLFRRFQADFLLLIDRPAGSEGIAGSLDAARRDTLHLLHVLRLVSIHRICLLAVHIPEFSPHGGNSRESLIEQLFRLDVPAAVTTLKRIFPRTERDDVPAEALAEPASYKGDVVHGYAREHETLFDPILTFYQINLLLGGAISTEIGAVG